MPLDEFLPRFDFSEHHQTTVSASPERTLAAALALTARETPVALGLMALRRLPARLKAVVAGGDDGPQPSPGPVLQQLERAGFVKLAERPSEVVLGVVGRFWELGGGARSVSAAEFVRFAEPGYAKAVVDFRVEPAPAGCLLSTETRVACTDDGSRRTFGRYWRVVHPGSALIRREWLRAIRRRAERETGG